MKTWKKKLLKEWWNKYPDYFPLGARYRGLWQKGRVTQIIKELDERKLDIEIATKIFHYIIKVGERTEYQDYGGQIEYPELQYLAEVFTDGSGEDWQAIPHYSTDLKDAFLIVEKLKKDLAGIEIMCFSEALKGQPYQVKLHYNAYSYDFTSGNTIELAICKAAFTAKGFNEN